MPGDIFISYRRDDDPHFAGRLHDRLAQAFPEERLFMDVDNIAPGLDFVQELEKAVAHCDVLLAVIGPRWLEARDGETGSRRLDNPDDFVRIEIEIALKRDIRVIPVLVEGAAMPRAKELPGALEPLARRNAIHMSHARFSADSAGLIKAIERALSNGENRAQALKSEEAKLLAESERKEVSAPARRLSLSFFQMISGKLKWFAAAAVLAVLAAGGLYLGVIRPAQLQQDAARYSEGGSFACINDATFPDSWRSEMTCLPFGCNFGSMDREACLALGARKGAKIVIHGNAGSKRVNECWLQQSCGNLQRDERFSLFRLDG